ncbi:fibronectin type III domain protein, partial [Opisthorchis viverrini]
YHYVVITYDQKQQIVNKLNVSDRQTTLDGLDGCSEYWVTIRAIGIEGPSNESRAVKIHSTSAPSAPTDIQIRKYEQTKLMVSWNDSSECRNYSGHHYTVAVYDNQMQLVDELNTTDLSVTLVDLDLCSEYWVTVRAVGPGGHSNESGAVKIDAVSVYDRQIQLVDERNTSGHSVTWDDLDLCPEYWVTVRAIRSAVRSNESTAVRISGRAAPKTPTNLRIYRAEGLQNWLLFWDDSSECQTHPDYHYILSVYNLYYQRVLQGNVSERYVTMENFYVCAGFWIRVRSIASWGQSEDSLAVKLSDFTAPKPPTNFRMERNTESHAWCLSWDDSSECQTHPGYHYIVGISDRYDQRTLQRRVRNKYIMLDDFYVCADFRVRIRSVGLGKQSMESPAVRLSEFSGKQPEPPYNVMIQLQILKRMVMVSWTQSCARSFTVAFYVGTLVTRLETTYKSNMTFGNLPRNQSLHVGITALNEYGRSDEAPSPHFCVTPS